MGVLHVEASGTTQASPEDVWALIADATTYHVWGPWDESGYRDDNRRGAGAVRWMRYGRTITREQITELHAPHDLSYTVVGGLPVREYVARVTLTPTDGGTHIHWAADWRATLLGRVVHRKLRTLYPEVLHDLIAAAEHAPH
ncbi:SRPBCC family protein [Cellulomonas sp. P24]|uniref:SRPBCC family protein n=1 Tax=Cellulomonas sp. P24 TaxID=2885206 RepID=UPI00216B1829|nr:SRPBCC family protein [Cellulomonas sp. P24]MCR6493627.1 SRPBCC family protein [Cellulomonas sp. P24]